MDTLRAVVDQWQSLPLILKLWGLATVLALVLMVRANPRWK